MHWQYTPYAIPVAIVAVVTLALAVPVCRRRTVRGAVPLGLAMAAVVVWCAGYGLELVSTSFAQVLLLTKIEYIGIVSAPLLWMVFAAEYSRRDGWLTRSRLLLLATIPVATLVFMWTNETHHLMYIDPRLDTSGPFPVIQKTWGPWFPAHVAYSYSVLAYATYALVGSLSQTSRHYRGQTLSLLIGAVLPWAGNAAYLLKLGPLPQLDVTTPAFALSCAAVAWGIFRHRLLDLRPVAREAIVEDMSDGMIVLDALGRVIDINRAGQSLLGLTANQVVGRPASEAFNRYPALLGRFGPATSDLLHAEVGIGPDEGEPYYDVRISAIRERDGELAGHIVIVRDITERQRTGRQLERRLSEMQLLNRIIAANSSTREPSEVLSLLCAELAGALRVSQAAFALLNQDHTLLTVVAEYCAEGRRPALNAIIPVDDNPATQYVLQHRTPLAIYDAQTDPRQAVIHDLEKERGTASLLIVPLIVRDEVIGTFGVDSAAPREFSAEEIALAQSLAATAGQALQNAQLYVALQLQIAEQTRGKQALWESEQKYRTLFEVSSDAIFLESLEGHILDCNLAACSLFGYDRGAMLTLSLADLVPSAGAKPPAAVLEAESVAGGWMAEAVGTTKDGGVFPIELTTRLTPVGGEQRVIVYVRDSTARKRLEEELLRAQKLESVGLLAGGIAHDFNNILTAVLGNVGLARRHVQDNAAVAGSLLAAETAALRARSLTQQLLTFSRGGAPIRQTASIAELLRDTTAFVLAGSDVRARFDIADDLWAIDVDPGQLSQVIHNLVINAQQAMPGGGVVEIEAGNLVSEAGEEPALPKGKFVELSIRDYGVGIAPEHLPRIFDPYFTTKPNGRGLGLATSYAIIKNHDGHISVDSRVGGGATFRIYLPAAPGAPAEQPRPADAQMVGRGSVLVMDDEESVRDTASRILSDIGYEVRAARDGVEAIKLCRKMKDAGVPFDALILDLTVPGGMGGREAIDYLREIDPNVPVLVSSGYSNDPVMANFRECGFAGVVSKPYRVEELYQVLRTAIDSRAGN